MTFSAEIQDKLTQISQISHRRYRGIAAAALSAFLGKGANLLVSAATVPITARYLGSEGYGLWMTISSTVALFFVLDIGISTTLTNLISEAYAKSDRTGAASYFATAFWVLLGIATCLGIVGWIIWPQIHWVSIFHVQDPAVAYNTSRAVAAAFVVFLLALPTGLVSKVLGGYQELHAANLFATGGSALSFLVVLAVVYFHGSLPVLVAGFAGSAVAANVVCLFWMCFSYKPWMKPRLKRVKPSLIGRIFRSGFQFFAVQLAVLIVFSSDNLIISHFLGPAQVTPYAVTWRLVSYIAAVQTLIFPALWPAYSEAFANRDLPWIRTTYSRVRRITIIVLTIGCSMTLLAGRNMIRLWAGSAAVPEMKLIWLMCAWIVIYAFATNQLCLMVATYRVGKQAISALAAAVVNLLLSVLWVKTMGPPGVVLATIVSYVVFIIVVQTWEVRKILHGDFSSGANKII
jgi:O-antigen/teichoic acid export membrane protein